MKVITIGRDLDNDIVIHDSKVSRHHVQIIDKGSGNYRIVDLGSTNGVFVNDRKISGETPLLTNDVVCIGNTVLPWQTYFPERKYTNHLRLYSGIAGIAAVTVIAVVLSGYFQKPQKTRIKMHEKNGVHYIPMKINGQELDFIFDTGASSICISTLEALGLVKNGLLSENDILGEQGFTDATGRISVGVRINLKTVQIGNKELTDVEATVIENPLAECLLGQTVLSRFGKYTIDNQHNEIIFE
jgi:aspartyl protease family protein